MLLHFLMRTTSSVLSAVLGGTGIFCVVYSFVDPALAWRAMILLGAAIAIVYCTE